MIHRNIAVDILKLILAFMVVAIHTHFLNDTSLLASYLMNNGIFRIAVPIFFLINGFYFYHVITEKEPSVWFKRVIYLYMFWMVFYAYFWVNLSKISLISLIKTIFIEGYYHLWYLPGMIGAALVLMYFHKNSNGIKLGILIGITFITGIIIQYSGTYHLVENTIIDKLFNYNWAHRNFLFLAFPFFTFGFLINKYQIYKKISREYIILLSLIGILFMIGESYFNYINTFGKAKFDNLISLIILCPMIFIAFIRFQVNGNSKDIALYSTGIYFVHILFLLGFQKFTNFDGTLLTFLIFGFSIAGTFLLIKINRKVKFIL